MTARMNPQMHMPLAPRLAPQVDPIDDEDDNLATTEGRPLVVWLLMAVALVAMAFLLGSAPQALAKDALPRPAAKVPANASAAPAALGVASLAFGG